MTNLPERVIFLLESALEAMRQINQAPKEPNDGVSQVISTVCDWYEITQAQIMRNCREQWIVYPRMVAMYLLTEKGESSARAATALGKSDHGSALYARKFVTQRMSTDPKFKQTIDTLKTKLNIT